MSGHGPRKRYALLTGQGRQVGQEYWDQDEATVTAIGARSIGRWLFVVERMPGDEVRVIWDPARDDRSDER